MQLTDFHYFSAPPRNVCSYSGHDTCVLRKSDGPGIWEDGSGHVCFDCVKLGRYGIRHSTELGILLPTTGLLSETASQKKLASDFDRVNLAGLLKTPRFVTWQGERWLVCCHDFMIYFGEWKPGDFTARAPEGDGHKFFMSMFEGRSKELWDMAIPKGAAAPDDWYVQIHVFQCGLCGRFRGHLDMP